MFFLLLDKGSFKLRKELVLYIIKTKPNNPVNDDKNCFLARFGVN